MNAWNRTWMMWIVRGVASLLFGVLAILRPGASVAALVLVYGAYALVEGASLLVIGLRRHHGGKAPFIVRGLISGAAGVVALAFPGPTALAFYVLIGAWALASGVAEIALAIALRAEGVRVFALFAAGVLSLAFGVALFALPAFGVMALVALIATFALVNGALLVAIGVSAHQLVREAHVM